MTLMKSPHGTAAKTREHIQLAAGYGGQFKVTQQYVP